MAEDYTAGQIRKALVAGAATGLTIISVAAAQGDVIPEGWMKWAVLAISLGTTLGVFKVPNDDPSQSAPTSPVSAQNERVDPFPTIDPKEPQ